MSRLATLGLVLGTCTLTLFAQVVGGSGPDVITGDLIDTQNWGTNGAITAYSVGTTSCNIGTVNLTWNAATNQHPVIAQNMFRLKNGRFEQLGQSWLKHGFFALSQTLCGPCLVGSDGSSLNVGCSDPYGAGLNGSHGLLGPRNEVNASTGYFPYPPGTNYPVPDVVIGQRLQVLTNEINPASNAGAQYFVEGHYVHPEDAAAGNKNNNASYRACWVSPVTFQLNWFSGPGLSPLVTTTQQAKPGIFAWKDTDPEVQIHTIDVPGDGRLFVAFKGSPGPNNTVHYEFAVQNLNSDRSVGSFAVELWPGATPTNMGMRLVPYHSGEPYVNTPWTPTFIPGTMSGNGSLTWACDSGANASALRWGNMYNFWFDCNQLAGNVTLGIFKPGSPTTMAVPAFCPPKRPPPGPQPAYTLATSVPYDFVNIATGSSFGPIGDDVGSVVNLPWAFPFYGGSYTQIGISTNGYLALPTGAVTGDLTKHTNTALPDAGQPSGMIAGYWDDLNCPNLGDVRYKIVNNRFIVNWSCVHNGSVAPLQFQVILEQNGTITNTIVVSPAGPLFQGAGATRGIEAPNNTEGIQMSFNTPGSAFAGTSARYSPNNQVPLSSHLMYAGKLSFGGPFRIAYTSVNNSACEIIVSAFPGPTDLGPLGVFPIDLFTAIGVFDCYGILTGVPDPLAVTSGPCSSLDVTIPIPFGLIPGGITLYWFGVDLPPSGPVPPNGLCNLANGITIIS